MGNRAEIVVSQNDIDVFKAYIADCMDKAAFGNTDWEHSYMLAIRCMEYMLAREDAEDAECTDEVQAEKPVEKVYRTKSEMIRYFKLLSVESQIESYYKNNARAEGKARAYELIITELENSDSDYDEIVQLFRKISQKFFEKAYRNNTLFSKGMAEAYKLAAAEIENNFC